MTPQDELRHVGKSFTADRKAVCRGCGSKWYEEHYKNGFCYDCQRNGTMDSHVEYSRNQKLLTKMIFAIIIVGSMFIGFLGLYSIFT